MKYVTFLLVLASSLSLSLSFSPRVSSPACRLTTELKAIDQTSVGVLRPTGLFDPLNLMKVSRVPALRYSIFAAILFFLCFFISLLLQVLLLLLYQLELTTNAGDRTRRPSSAAESLKSSMGASPWSP